MPPPNESEAFCLALKTARQRRGLKLESIAEATKVCVSYYAALENANVQRWPKGLFRRSFFRGYVEAIGLPVDATVEEFARLFPEDDRDKPAVVEPGEVPVRLSLDRSWHGTRAPLRARAIHAAIDAVAVLLLSAVAWLVGVDLSVATAAIAVAYFTIATLLFGESPAAFVKRWIQSFDTPESGEPAAADESEPREWVTDARRVRPRDTTARLRVRFKSSH